MHLGKFPIPIWVIMLVSLAISLSLWVWMDTLNEAQHCLFYEIAGRLCEAVAIASILGATVDGFLKVALIRDVFEVSLGYLLPAELRPEMAWIYGQNIICDQHNQKYDLSIHGDQVLMNCSYERTFRNVSNKTQKIPLAVHIDNWFGTEDSSKVHEIGYIRDDNRTICQVKTFPDEYSVRAEGGEITLKPNESATVWFKFMETKHINDAAHIVFTYPTKNPRVEVNCPDSLGVHFGFANRSEWTDLSDGVKVLRGTLMPHQHIMVRWWDKTQPRSDKTDISKDSSQG